MSSPDDDDRHYSLSIASLGSSTLNEGPKRQYIHKPSQAFSDEKPRERNKKPDLFSTADIDGAQPRKTHQRSVPSNTLSVSDIDGASVKIKDKFLQTKRHVDPLQPNYQLPSYTLSRPPEPKFLKDSMNVDDIEGTKPAVKSVFQPRDTLNVDDIEGSKAGWKPRHRILETRDIMATGDAKKIKFQDRTTRISNSLSPSYSLHGIEIKDSPRSRPRKLKGQIKDSHLLKTSDIEGAQAGYISQHQLSVPLESRREFRNTNFIGDIDGSSADSVKHSITTKRELNPLQPIYPSLDGHGEVLKGCVEPLVPPDCIKFDASSFKAHGTIRELNTDGTLRSPLKNNSFCDEDVNIITHQSLSSMRSKHSTPKSINSGRKLSGSGLFDTGESFQGLGSGNATSNDFLDTSDFNASKSYGEKFSNSDLVTSDSARVFVPKLDTSASGGHSNNSARRESKKSTSRSGNVTPDASQPSSSRKNSRTSVSVASRRAMEELEAEVNAIRSL